MIRAISFLIICVISTATFYSCSDGGDGSGGQVAEEPQSCEVEFDCAPEDYCAEGECRDAACTGQSDCADGFFCKEGRCGAGCLTDEDCDGAQVCDEESNSCVPDESVGCSDDSDCQLFEECDETLEPPACVPRGSCETELHCIRYERHVNDGNRYVCGAEGECVEAPPCTQDGECRDGEICQDDECVPGCRSSDDCLLGETCSSDNVCVDA